MAIPIGIQGIGPEPGRPPLEAWVVERFYAGGGMPCPVGCGGAAEVIRVGSREDGGGDLWLECGSCAQRHRFDLPPATVAERGEVEAALAEVGEAACPRHAGRVVLQRRGSRLVCPQCGVRFRE
jgi:hypothetical protein